VRDALFYIPHEAFVEGYGRAARLSSSDAFRQQRGLGKRRTDESHRVMVVFNDYFHTFADFLEHGGKVICYLAIRHVNRCHASIIAVLAC
jgi:hypothetical protein